MFSKKTILSLMLGLATLGFSSTADAARGNVLLDAGQHTYFMENFFQERGWVAAAGDNFRITVFDSTGFMVGTRLTQPGHNVSWDVRTPGAHRIVIENLNNFRAASSVATNGSCVPRCPEHE